MLFQFTSYVIVEIAAAVFLFFFAVYALLHIHLGKATKWVILLFALGSLWMLAHATEIGSANLLIKDYMNRLQFVLKVSLATFWLIFAITYTDRIILQKRIILLLCFVVPVCTLALSFTNEYHGLLWGAVTLNTRNSLLPLLAENRPLVWILAGYMYLIAIIGGLLLIGKITSKRTIGKRQMTAIVLIALSIFTAGIIDAFDLEQSLNIMLEPTAWAFLVGSAVAVWFFSRSWSGDIIPVAQEAIIENMNDLVIVIDNHERVLYLNSAAKRILCQDASPTSKVPLKQLFPELLDHSYPSDFLNNPATEVRLHRFGVESIYDVNVSMLGNADEGRLNWIFVLRDITQSKKLQSQLLITDRLTAIGKLASGVAHEINTPLTSIVCNSEILLDDTLPEYARDTIQVISSEAQRSAEIARGLLMFSRGSELEKQLLDVNQAIQVVINLRAHEHSNNNIKVITKFSPDLPDITANEFQLQQVFLNIIINAEHFMKEAHERGTLTVTTKRIGDKIQVSFHDDGIGIDEHSINHIFDPFFTTKEIGDGTGLGLSICHGIVTKYRGSIYATSKRGKGTNIIIELSIEPSHIDQSCYEAQRALSSKDFGKLSKVRLKAQVRQTIAGVKHAAIPFTIAAFLALTAYFLPDALNTMPSPSGPASQCTVTILRGSVEVMSQGLLNWQQGTDGMSLAEGTRLRTSSDAHALLTFFEGSTIKLEPNTDIEIQQINDTEDEPATILLKQWMGRTWSNVTKKADSGSHYAIETPSAVALVHGTLFATEVDGTGITTVATTEGLVSVVAQDEEVYVPAAQQTEVERGAPPSQTKPVSNPDAELVITFDMPVVGSVIDPTGSSTGYLPGGLGFNQIAGSQSSSPDGGTQTITIPEPMSGEYTVVLRYVGDGKASFNVDGRSDGGSIYHHARAHEGTNGSVWVIHVDVNVNDGLLSYASVSEIEPLGNDTPEKIVKTQQAQSRASEPGTVSSARDSGQGNGQGNDDGNNGQDN
ncbi:histidine kinase N-terminal 7TM domain-containing protein, partial [Bacteroidota bacterium]